MKDKGPRYKIFYRPYLREGSQTLIRDNSNGNVIKPTTSNPQAECIELNRIAEDEILYLNQVMGYYFN